MIMNIQTLSTGKLKQNNTSSALGQSVKAFTSHAEDCVFDFWLQ